MSRYSRFCERVKSLTQEKMYFDMLSNFRTNMFDYGDFEKIFEKEHFEFWLLSAGKICFFEKDGKQILTPEMNRTGSFDIYGKAKNISAHSLDTITEINNLEIGENVFIINNNHSHSPDYMVYDTARILAEIDKSREFNVKWSMLAPILKCTDSKTGTAIEHIIKDIFEGKLTNIVSENVVEQFMNGQIKDLTPVFLTQPEQIKNVQYLSELHDFELRKFYSTYGMNVQTTSKHAQVNQDEIHGFDSVSWVLPIEMLNEREKFINWYNEKYNTDYTVQFSEPWKTEYEKYMKKANENNEGGGNIEIRENVKNN